MGFKVIAQNQDIPKDLLVNEKIINVKFMGAQTVFFLENGYDFYFHNDTGEMELIKVDTEPDLNNNQKKKYNVIIENSDDSTETHHIELHDEINEDNYILVENRLIWITKVDGNTLSGIEQAETLEQCESFMRHKLRR